MIKNKAVLLDRDGVINKEIGHYVYTPEEFQINEGVIEFLKMLNQKGYLLIIISNQGGIGKGEYTIQNVDFLHEKLLAEFRKNGITVQEIFYCPHHPTKTKCLCRKPDSIMVEKAIAKYNIDTEKSLLIGDADRDIQAAEKAGLQAFKIISNDNLNENFTLKTIINAL